MDPDRARLPAIVAPRTAIDHAGAGGVARGGGRASLRAMSFAFHHSKGSHVFAAALTGLLGLAACGDDEADQPIDARVVDAAIDAPVCQLDRYPETLRVLSVDLQQQTTLTLDGTGTRCEQIERAVLSAGRPPELAELDVGGATTTCSHDDVTNREIVRIRAREYGGVPIYWPVQDALLHVDAANKVVFLHGDFLPAGHLPVAGCLSGPALAMRVPGRALEYQKFALCQPRGPGMYTIAGDDVIEVGEEGVYLDGDNGLRRVRAIDVYLAPAHVDSEVGNSDLFCCSGPSTDHCVGKRLFLDALTGETLAQEPHCHTC